MSLARRRGPRRQRRPSYGGATVTTVPIGTTGSVPRYGAGAPIRAAPWQSQNWAPGSNQEETGGLFWGPRGKGGPPAMDTQTRHDFLIMAIDAAGHHGCGGGRHHRFHQPSPLRRWAPKNSARAGVREARRDLRGRHQDQQLWPAGPGLGAKREARDRSAHHSQDRRLARLGRSSSRRLLVQAGF